MVILNIVLITMLLKGPFWKLRGERPRSETRVEYFLERKLDLTDSQVKLYRDLRKSHFKDTEIHLKEIIKLKKDLFSLVGKDNNQKKKRLVLNKIAHTQMSIDSLTFSHFEKLRSICNPAQKVKFDNVIGEVLHRMNRRGPLRPNRGRR